jgi:uncharacterized protein YndB with AHSA1/START domain
MIESDTEVSPAVTNSTPQEIVTTRIFDAPRERVWEIYTEPEHVVHWWGLKGAKLGPCVSDVTVGGVWRFVIRGTDGRDYPFSGVFQEVMPYERLVYTDGFGEANTVRMESVVTVTFEEQPGGKTKVTKRSVADPIAHQVKVEWIRRLQPPLEKKSKRGSHGKN